MLKFNSKTAIKVAYFSKGVSDNGTPYSIVAFSEKQNRRDNDKGTKDALIKIWNPEIEGEIKDGAFINVLSLKIDLDNDDGFKFKHNEKLKDGTWADRPAIEFGGGSIKVIG
jgi:hypothetical protein